MEIFVKALKKIFYFYFFISLCDNQQILLINEQMNTNYKLETKILTCLRANTSQKTEGEKLITKQFKYLFLRY